MIFRGKNFLQLFRGTVNPFKLLGPILVLMITGFVLQAQTIQEAKTQAYGGDREKARSICRSILAKNFDTEVAVLMARTYAWDGKYDSTKMVISQVLKADPEHWDALDCLSDVQFWEEKYKEAIESCNVILTKNANDEQFLFKKAKILNAMGLYDQAARQLINLLKSHPANAEARNKLSSIRADLRRNYVRLAYSYDSFEKNSNQDPWHLVALSYARKTKAGTIIGRVNWAERFGAKGVQYEVDGYPHFSENNYAYLNLGYSNLTIFPKIRTGAEWYHSFPKAFEGSLGMRALFFSNSDTYMLTGTVGKYTGNYWFSFRSYVIPSSSGTSVSGSIQTRRYFADPEDYIGLRVGYGISPDDRNYGNGSSSYLTLKSQSVRIEYNHLFTGMWTTNVGISLSHQQFPAIGYVRNYSFDFGIGRFF